MGKKQSKQRLYVGVDDWARGYPELSSDDIYDIENKLLYLRKPLQGINYFKVAQDVDFLKKEVMELQEKPSQHWKRYRYIDKRIAIIAASTSLIISILFVGMIFALQ
jgi:hypothetical protein